MSMETSIQNDIHNLLWFSKLKYLLERHGFAEVWYYPQTADIKLFIPVFKRRLIDNCLVELREGLNKSSSMTFYKELKHDFEISPYLMTLHNRKFRNAFSKFRLSPHQLAIETGRNTGIERQYRKCTLCTKDDIEDEFHFVLICPLYRSLRDQYISKYYQNHPSMFKFIQLCRSTGKKLKNLVIFLNKAFELRNSTLNLILR